MAYRIGQFVVTKNGALECEFEDALELMVESLAFEGMHSLTGCIFQGGSFLRTEITGQ